MGSLSKLCRYLPISRHKIVFSNFNGRGYGDSPKYIAEEILRRELGYDLVWLVNDLQEEMPRGVRKVPLFTRRGRYELSTAKIIINNVKIPLPYEKKAGQYYIQTWHGDFPLKFIEGEIEHKLDPFYVDGSKLESTQIDLLLSGTKLMSNVYRNAFWYDGEIFEFGLPRNDVFFRDNQHQVCLLKNGLRIIPSSRIALYAPTFRNGLFLFGLPDFESLHRKLESTTNNTWVIIVRFHPNDQSRTSEITFSDWLIDGSSLPDMQDLEVASDLLITDYSSSVYDFLLQQKPIIRFASDLEHYKEERGLRGVYWALPIPLCINNEQLLKALPSVFTSEYIKCISKFTSDKLGSFDKGDAAARVVDRIIDVIHGSRR